MSRLSRLYSFWAEMKRAEPRWRAIQSASAACHPARLDDPEITHLPFGHSSPMATTVSSSGVNGSG